MREFRVYAPAKLNLYLDILEKRPDGYHNIKTLFEKIDLKDEIVVREKEKKGLEIKVEGPYQCPSGKDNIVYRAIQELFRVSNVDFGLEIIVKKKIPVAGGLGGGSSDAASVLRSINEKFGLGVSFDQLFSIAAKTGRDIPFFMLDAPFAIGKGAGEILEPVNINGSFTHIIARPNISISTKDMYKRWDEGNYRSEKIDIGEIVCTLQKRDLTLLRKTCYNIFDQIETQSRPFIEKVKLVLEKAGAGPSCLSGSGPTVFCTVKDKDEAGHILKNIPMDKGIDIFLAATYKGGIYGDNRSQDISKGRVE
ncbi:MAG: 4-(cytidine 5'-diphospho)-2-C-methyl-D-erythritol kinase [Candidatus Omnitrophica bacterium]|nr:4-(cytidine 5'-diphospho)-2-C-methyl-D-erythritol kinase [Candidatus Omnitrophota bacterium]